MNWLKKAYQDSSTKWMTAFIVLAGPVCAGLSYWIDPNGNTWWQGWVFFWGMYLVVVLPLLYLNRNNP